MKNIIPLMILSAFPPTKHNDEETFRETDRANYLADDRENFSVCISDIEIPPAGFSGLIDDIMTDNINNTLLHESRD